MSSSSNLAAAVKPALVTAGGLRQPRTMNLPGQQFSRGWGLRRSGTNHFGRFIRRRFSASAFADCILSLIQSRIGIARGNFWLLALAAVMAGPALSIRGADLANTQTYLAFVDATKGSGQVSQDQQAGREQDPSRTIPTLQTSAAPAPSASLAEINPPVAGDADSVIAIVGATLVDGGGGPAVRDSAVVVHGEKIMAAGSQKATPIPESVAIYDASGLTLLPSLIDAHFHIEQDYQLPRLYLLHGVTSLRDPGVPIERYDRIRLSSLAQPRCFMAGPHLDCPPVAHPQDSFVVTGAEETRHAVNRFVDQGASVIKVYYRLPLELIVVACDAAHQRGVPVTAHLELVDADAAIAAGLDGIEHVTSFGTVLAEPDEAARFRAAVTRDNRARGPGRYQLWSTLDLEHSPRVKPLLDLIVRRKVFVSPTLAVFEKRRGDPNTTEIEARGFENMLRFVRLCHRAGVTLVVGSHSSVPKAERGWAYQREMELLIECGLTPGEALSAATRNNAAFFRQSTRLGSVAPGKLADLLLVAGDPLQDIQALRQVRRVMLNGRWISPSLTNQPPTKAQSP
jgi:imidazolonepropionase-like amidohydrolase